MVRPLVLAAVLFILAGMIISPAQAFTAKSLDIAVQQNGDAVITFDYGLSWAENFAVFMRIGDPGTELKKALESNFGKTVDVTMTDSGRSQFVVHDFAQVKERNSAITMKSPTLSFASADKVLKKYWFAQMINPDFSPAVTRVSFPDGYYQEFQDQMSIPAISHTLAA
jgi:hypothetical protein